MPGIYKLFTALVAVIGNISLISTGEMNPAFSFIGSGLLWGYYRSLKNYPTLSKWAVGGLSLGTFVVFLIDASMTGDILLSVAQMTLIFQTIKAFDIKDPWDPLQVFFVSLLQLLIASEFTHAISFGIIFLVFLVFVVVSVLLGHFVKEGQEKFRPFFRPIALITSFTLILTIVFFISVPRLRSSLWGKGFLKGIKTTGFSEKVDFGSFGEVKLDETVIMRMVLNPDVPGPHYLRGMTFDYFDGFAWYDATEDTRRIFRTTGDFNINVPKDAEKYEADIFLEPIDSDVIFTFRMPYKILSAGYFMRKDNAGSFYMKQKVSKRFFYKVLSIDGYYYDNRFIESYLQFPDGMSSVKELVEEITSDTSDDFERARAIRTYLLGNYAYSLYTDEPGDGSSAIEYFLFHSRKGFCEHFATAMTLMLRSIGIPARLVTGFLGSQKNAFGDYYVIRQSDAHSWVEAFIENRWVLFDPTPPVISSKRLSLTLFFDMMNLNWNRYVVGFSFYDQSRITSYFLERKRIIGKLPEIGITNKRIMVVALITCMFVLVYRIRRKRNVKARYRDDISTEYMKFRKRVAMHGGNIAQSSTSGEVLREALGTGRFHREEVVQFIERYRFLRFSGRADSDMLSDYFRMSGKLKK